MHFAKLQVTNRSDNPRCCEVPGFLKARQPMTFIEQALKGWNSDQPAWKPVLRFDQLTPALQSEIELRAEALERAELLTIDKEFTK